METPEATPVENVTPATGKATIYKKMAAVMGAVKRVEKRGYNKDKNYDFVTAEDVKDIIRRAMAEQGLALLPSVRKIERAEGKSKSGTPYIEYRVDVEFAIACGETGEVVTIPWYGEAQDYQDKGFNKALTAATKYFLINTFLVSTGEERDADAGPASAEPEQASAEAMGGIVALYRAQNPGVKVKDDAILATLFDKVCGKDSPFTAANATKVALVLAAKAAPKAEEVAA